MTDIPIIPIDDEVFQGFKKSLEKAIKKGIEDFDPNEAILVYWFVLDDLKSTVLCESAFNVEGFYGSDDHEKLHNKMKKLCTRYIKKGLAPFVVISALQIFVVRAIYSNFVESKPVKEFEGVPIYY